jgi:hypothetical protein
MHSDIRHGFVIGFDKEPDISIKELEQKVLTIIEQDLPIEPGKGNFVILAGQHIACTGKRIHVKSSRQIEGFRLLKNYVHDPISRQYLLVGIVGRGRVSGLHEFPPAGRI